MRRWRGVSCKSLWFITGGLLSFFVVLAGANNSYATDIYEDTSGNQVEKIIDCYTRFDGELASNIKNTRNSDEKTRCFGSAPTYKSQTKSIPDSISSNGLDPFDGSISNYNNHISSKYSNKVWCYFTKTGNSDSLNFNNRATCPKAKFITDIINEARSSVCTDTEADDSVRAKCEDGTINKTIYTAYTGCTDSSGVAECIKDDIINVAKQCSTNSDSNCIDSGVNNEAGNTETGSLPQTNTSGQCGNFDFGDSNPDCTLAGDDVKETATNCRIDGVGWLVCPTADFIAKASDSFYDLIVGLLEIPSDEIFTNAGTAFAAYRNFLPLANIILAILFVLIIYSEATGNGFGALSNYSVKKLLPRLVIFAILVNVSWYLCAAAVDISNILGANIIKFFTDTSYQISQDKGKSSFWDGSGMVDAKWVPIVAAIVVGFQPIADGMHSDLRTAATAGMAIIGPLLALVAVVLIVSWLILIIRQAAVIILSITSPIAIAMGMLPNTKKAYDKWLSTFFGMLIVWPAIGLIIGGAKIASSIMDASSGTLWNGGQKLQATAMAIASVASRSIPLIAIPFVLLGSLKLFGKLGVMLGRMGQSRIKQTGRWTKQSAGREVNTGFNRAMRKRLQSRPDPENQNRLQRFIGRFTLPGLYQQSYENKQAAAEANQTLQNKLADNYEQKAQESGTFQRNTRARANEAELRNAEAKAFSEKMKQEHIATGPAMKDLNNHRLAHEASAKQSQFKQYDNYVNALKAENDSGTLTTIATTADITGGKPAKSAFPLSFSPFNKKNAIAGTPTANPLTTSKNRQAEETAARTRRRAGNPKAPLPSMPLMPTVSTGSSSLPLDSIYASALATQNKNSDYNKKARQSYLRRQYSSPTELADAINNGQINSSVEVDAAVDLIHDMGDGSQSSEAAKAYSSLLGNAKTMQNHAATITRSAASSKALKESDTAMWLGARDYSKPIDEGGSGNTGPIDRRKSFAAHKPELLQTNAKSASKWNEEMWEAARSIDNDTTMEFSDLAARAQSAGGSGIGPGAKSAITTLKKEGRNIAIDRSKDSQYMSIPDNIKKISDNRALKEVAPTITKAAEVKLEKHETGVVTMQDRFDASYYRFDDIYGGMKHGDFDELSDDEIRLHGQTTKQHLEKGDKVEGRNMSLGKGEPDKSDDERSKLYDEHDKMLADTALEQAEIHGINTTNADALASSRIIDSNDWSVGQIASEVLSGERRPISGTDIISERKKYSGDFLKSQRRAALDFAADTGKKEGFDAGTVAKALRDIRKIGGTVDKDTQDAFVRAKQTMHSKPMTYSDKHDQSAWKRFDSEVK